MAHRVDLHLADPEEAVDAGDLTAAVYVGGGYIPSGDAYVERLADGPGRANDAELWVATDEGRMLGCVTFCPEGSPWRELAAPGEGEFRMLAVSPDARGRGVGAALVGRCIERARELGLGSLVLSTMEPMTSAHRLYGRFGFRRIPEHDWSPANDVCLWAYRMDL
ncbi:MAG: GNAT family N-acetyltransferase [Actinomycetota bacterium]|nr:GNAT family N-acetyltransferase [Actinomycetota bacterium]